MARGYRRRSRMGRSSAAEGTTIAFSPAIHHEPIVRYLAALRVMTLRTSSEASTTPADSMATSVPPPWPANVGAGQGKRASLTLSSARTATMPLFYSRTTARRETPR
jgi:hypothetical protein